MNEYEEQANEFLKLTGTKLTVEYLKTGKHFESDADDRDIFACELSRGSRSFKFNFGNSIANSGKYIGHKNMCLNAYGKYLFNEQEYQKMRKTERFSPAFKDVKRNNNYKEPDAYSILTALTDYDPGTLENFCSDFGYDTDSKKDEKIYNAVVDEWKSVCMLFSEEELELLREIN